MSISLDRTRQFNRGRTRAILAGGQAVVLHRLAIMSKDGDWILREEPETMEHILSVLEGYGARYRFGAPLDVRWLAMIEFRDEFLSQEDLDLQALTDDELDAVWTAWLYQAQVTDDEDRYTYSHGVFTHEPVADGDKGPEGRGRPQDVL